MAAKSLCSRELCPSVFDEKSFLISRYKSELNLYGFSLNLIQANPFISLGCICIRKSIFRVPTKSSHVSENPATVKAALSAVNPDDPVGQEALSQMDHLDDDRAGTITLGVSHILKFLRENSEKEELRRQKKEQEKAAQPQPAIPDEMEQRRAKIEELQLRREATLAEDKAKQMEAMMQAMRKQAIERDRLLKKIFEELEANKSKTSEPENEEEECKKQYKEAMSDVNNVLTNVESGVMAHLVKKWGWVVWVGLGHKRICICV
ncbi:uncharacterized protein PGTG_14670 [Puccinia graminis f. sp. tritici CRL 75-36-700-3]|uniref:Uncharacterized protein n=1 Tax=Puccinia graminis f. sp. tritici (strain CRL 75-36-700-3 / race SCCL) TaxID=418459 RepID=E3KWN7_PUCGT|nr:uncharacterized protein PGTG_14670 [Puccinia graminis f. sp. tritici CRL 75-36-700-3]EFP88704.2 hypothetical protein PGTG_14670 [Puccinia graminis f. sp. tritici CRL 75-36-700-3]